MQFDRKRVTNPLTHRSPKSSRRQFPSALRAIDRLLATIFTRLAHRPTLQNAKCSTMTFAPLRQINVTTLIYKVLFLTSLYVFEILYYGDGQFNQIHAERLVETSANCAIRSYRRKALSRCKAMFQPVCLVHRQRCEQSVLKYVLAAYVNAHAPTCRG